jgi:hypothetical protein
MSTPSGITERITELLREHTFAAGTDEVPGECVGATCTWHGWWLSEWREHVAAVLVAELGLQPSTGLHYDDPVHCYGCGEKVPLSIALRDDVRPFHWNEQGGGHTCMADAYSADERHEPAPAVDIGETP